MFVRWRRPPSRIGRWWSAQCGGPRGVQAQPAFSTHTALPGEVLRDKTCSGVHHHTTRVKAAHAFGVVSGSSARCHRAFSDSSAGGRAEARRPGRTAGGRPSARRAGARPGGAAGGRKFGGRTRWIEFGGVVEGGGGIYGVGVGWGEKLGFGGDLEKKLGGWWFFGEGKWDSVG